MSTMSETDPDHQYTGDGERENPEEGRIDADEGTTEEEDPPHPDDDDR